MAAMQHDSDQVAEIAEKIRAGKTSLGIEFGSTRIKAVLIDDEYRTIASGDYGWASHLENGLWSYTVEEIWKGLQSAYAEMAGDVEAAYGEKLTHIGHIGFSAMMHGYLAFDEAGELLVPFRTWQNTNTHEAHEKLSELFQYNIPERWSIAHLYQCVLNNEEHISKVAFFTTLAGYVHWKLTGKKVLGVGDASGMFPIDPTTRTWETEFIQQFNALPEVAAQPWKLEDLLPEPLVAGTPAGELTEEGAKLLDPTGTLQPGITLAPPEGDAGTGMMATNSVRKRTGNVSAGTSIFATVVLEGKLKALHPEVDLVTTPAGDLAGMSHANNFTSDLNAWVNLFGQFAEALGHPVDAGTLYGTLFRSAIADDVDANCGGLLNYPFRSGEFLAGLPEGRPPAASSPPRRWRRRSSPPRSTPRSRSWPPPPRAVPGAWPCSPTTCGMPTRTWPTTSTTACSRTPSRSPKPRTRRTWKASRTSSPASAPACRSSTPPSRRSRSRTDSFSRPDQLERKHNMATLADYGPEVRAEVKQVREVVATLHDQLIKWNLVVWTAGNVSQRLHTADLMVIKPSGRHRLPLLHLPQHAGRLRRRAHALHLRHRVGCHRPERAVWPDDDGRRVRR